MKRNLSDRWHAPFWLGGILIALMPFVVAIGFDGTRASWLKEAGSFGENMLRAVWWALGGAVVGGLLWLKLSGRTVRGSFRRWLAEKHRFHWVWYFLSVGMFGLHDYLFLEGFHFTPGEKVSAMFGRILTGAVVVGVYWLACGLASGLAPSRLRKWPWVVAAFLPFVVLADFLAILYWKNPVINLLNQLDERGTFDLGSNLASGGVAVPPWVVVVGFFAIVWCFYLVFHWSAGHSWTSRLYLQRWLPVAFLIGLWAGVWAEKVAGTGWKSREAQRWEHHAYGLHLTKGMVPPPGIAGFRVRFLPKVVLGDQARPAPGSERPDIFMIMIESTRQDALDPRHAPFLSYFREEECQDLGSTWSSSNSTPLSWYGLFHGVLPVHWAGEKAAYVNTRESPTPAFFRLLKQSGYRMGIHTVSDLSYQSIGPVSFGSDQDIYEIFSQSPVGETPLNDYHREIPQREKEAFASAAEALRSAPSNGNFHFIALDSTHYGYRWHEEFDPPYADYYTDSGVPAFPNSEDIASMKRWYYNSIAWVDWQVHEFCTELRRQGRYEDSLIIVTGDHGEEFHENGSWFHSSSLLPAQTQVPLLIKWPRGIEAPPQSSASHLDLLPTFRDFLGYPPHAGLPGKSLLWPSRKERTQISFACNTGISGVCMAWYRKGWVATFRWENPFAHQPPGLIHLDNVTTPDGTPADARGPAEWKELLQEKFPDAPGRLFEKFDLLVEEE